MGFVRKDLKSIVLDDGTKIMLNARLSAEEETETVKVALQLYNKADTHLHYPTASVELTTIVFSKGASDVFALLYLVDDKIHLYTPWDDRFFIVNKNTYQIMEQGRSAETLRTCARLVPIKVNFWAGSTGVVRPFRGP